MFYNPNGISRCYSFLFILDKKKFKSAQTMPVFVLSSELQLRVLETDNTSDNDSLKRRPGLPFARNSSSLPERAINGSQIV